VPALLGISTAFPIQFGILPQFEGQECWSGGQYSCGGNPMGTIYVTTNARKSHHAAMKVNVRKHVTNNW
jgi:hypothetical protein